MLAAMNTPINPPMNPTPKSTKLTLALMAIVPLWFYWLGGWAWSRIVAGAPKRFAPLEPLAPAVPIAIPLPIVAAPASASARMLASSQPEA